MTWQVRQANWKNDAEACKQIRFAVFVDEQKVPLDLEIDGKDPDCWHVLVEQNQQAIATGRMLPDGHIGRIAVLAERRQEGIGVAIMRCLINTARQEKLARVYLHAQDSAKLFYQNLGFTIDGPAFMEAGILHHPMSLSLSHA